MKKKLAQKAAAVKGETPKIELSKEGGFGVSTVFVGDTDFYDEDALLRGWGLDPDVWAIQEDTLRVNRWLQSAEENIWAYQYKAAVTKRQNVVDVEEIPPLVTVDVKVKTTRAKRVEADLKCAVIFPDAQISFWKDENEEWRTTHDEGALEISRMILADIQAEHGVDAVVDLGDFLDCTHFSRHRSMPSQIDRRGFQKAIARGQEELAVRTALTPDAERWLIPGNHENRILHWIGDNAPWLGGLSPDGGAPMLSLEWLLQTDKHGWNVAESYPEGAVYLNPSTRCIHGTVAKGTPGASAGEYLKHEVNTFFGHTPRSQTVYRTIARHGHTRTYVASTAGGLMRTDGAVPSGTTGVKITGDPVLAAGTAWDQGFSLVFFDEAGDCVPYVETISIFGGRSVWRGREYAATVDADGRPL